MLGRRTYKKPLESYTNYVHLTFNIISDYYELTLDKTKKGVTLNCRTRRDFLSWSRR